MSNPFAPNEGSSQDDAANQNPTHQPRDPYRVPSNDQGSEPPKFGQRSDSWTPNQTSQGQPAAGQGGAEGGAQSDRPWPVYQQGSAPQTSSWGSASAGPESNGYGNEGTGAQGPFGTAAPYPQQNQFPQNGQPFQQPYGQQPYGQPGPSQSTPYMQQTAPSGPPPSRAGAIWTLVIGIVTMVLIAPITFVVVLLSGFGLGSLADGSLYVANGDTVVVDETGVVGVSPASGETDSCVLIAQDGTETTMRDEDSAGIFIGRNLAAGEYTVSCDDVATGQPLVFFTGDMVNGLVGSAFSALGWATAVGVTGLILTIVGIVWLVRRNRARREYFYGRGY